MYIGLHNSMLTAQITAEIFYLINMILKQYCFTKKKKERKKASQFSLGQLQVHPKVTFVVCRSSLKNFTSLQCFL